MKNVLMFFAACFLALSQAYAVNFCSDIVVDEAKLLNPSQFAQVTDAAQKLKSTGVDVRVQTLPNLHGQPSLEALKNNFITKCGSWRSKDGGMKNDLVVLMIATDPGTLTILYGDGLKSKLDKRTAPIRNGIAAKIRDGNMTAGIVTGLGDVTDLVSMKASHQDVPVTINHSADMSGLWTILGWLAAAGTLGIVIFFGLKIFDEKERRRSAQNKAKTEKLRCSVAINGFEGQYAVLVSRIKQSNASETKKAKLLAQAAEVRARQNRVLAEYSAVNRSNNDPDTLNLSVAEYDEMVSCYGKIAESLDSFALEIGRIEVELKSPEVAETTKPVEEAPKVKKFGPDDSFQSGKQPHAPEPPKREYTTDFSKRGARVPKQKPTVQSTPAPTVSHTTVVNNTTVHDDGGLLTGIILGQAMSNHHDHHHYDEPSRRYEPPAAPSSRGNGEETSFGKSSMGNGEETSFGKSSMGNGEETSIFGGADFGRASIPDPEPERARDCAPSDCRPTDCQPSDCSKPSDCTSDCNCDCNCDCTSNTD